MRIMVPSGGVWCGRGERGCDRAEDLHNLPVAVSTQRAQRVVEIRVGLVVAGRRGRGRAKEASRADDRGASLAIGEQAEVADAFENGVQSEPQTKRGKKAAA